MSIVDPYYQRILNECGIECYEGPPTHKRKTGRPPHPEIVARNAAICEIAGPDKHKPYNARALAERFGIKASLVRVIVHLWRRRRA